MYHLLPSAMISPSDSCTFKLSLKELFLHSSPGVEEGKQMMDFLFSRVDSAGAGGIFNALLCPGAGKASSPKRSFGQSHSYYS